MRLFTEENIKNELEYFSKKLKNVKKNHIMKITDLSAPTIRRLVANKTTNYSLDTMMRINYYIETYITD